MYLLFVFAVIALFILVIGIGTSPCISNAYVKLLLKIFEYTHSTLGESKFETEERVHFEKRAFEKKSNAWDDEKQKENRIAIENQQEQEGQQEELKSREEQRSRKSHNNVLEKQFVPSPDNRLLCKKGIQNLSKFLCQGFSAIFNESVRNCFVAEKLKCWNLLTRHLEDYPRLTWQLKALWILGVLIRYLILLPVRFMLCCVSVTCISVASAVLSQLPESNRKAKGTRIMMRFCFRFMACSVSAVIRFHDTENRPKSGICVANHTTPLDVLILMCDANYSLIGQGHMGFLGLIQTLLKSVSPHMWFERAEAYDRHRVSAMLRRHIAKPNNPPILIFPEGTCINNNTVIKFKKGSFEISDVIAPVAIKYDQRFGRAFWDSTRYSISTYILLLITSWSLVCDVWYLPLMERFENETSIQFADRVKAAIARKANLANINLDGNLKRNIPEWKWPSVTNKNVA